MHLEGFFGSTVLGEDRTQYKIGIWDKDTKDESSNFQDFEKVVETLEGEAKGGHSKGAEINLCGEFYCGGCALQGKFLKQEVV
jgi:hypothetical protein